VHGVAAVREGGGFSDSTGAPGDFDLDGSINFKDDSHVNFVSDIDYSRINRGSCKFEI
jgi:hypothetical protein